MCPVGIGFDPPLGPLQGDSALVLRSQGPDDARNSSLMTPESRVQEDTRQRARTLHK